MLFAQTSDAVSSISSGAGWAGVAGTGLLSGVLGWLMFVHLPAKDKQVKEIIEAKDTQVKEFLEEKDKQITVILEHKWAAIASLSSDHKEAIKNLAAEFRAVIVETSQHCDKEIERLVTVVEKYRSVVQEKL